MAENKDKAPKRRGIVSTVIGNNKKASGEQEKETEKTPAKGADARKKQREALRRKRAAEERRRKEAREERAKAAKEKERQTKEKLVREKALKDKQAADASREFHCLGTESGGFETTLNKMYLNRKPWEPEDPKQILSFMPGMVEEIMVSTGDEVKAGDVLMIFRAMKMSNRMLSPVDGTVKSINVAQGENVPKNLLMIELS